MMECSTPAQQQVDAPAVVINDLSIVLVAPHIDTAHINPDFLRYNEIVAPDWQIDPPVIIESGFSLIEYDNGLSFTATDHNMRIAHSDGTLAMDEIVSPSVAKRYLAMAPWPVEYGAVHIDLNGSMDVADQEIERRFSPLHHLSSGMLFHDTAPNVQARAFYQFSDKSITVFIAESVDASFVSGVHFHGNISRVADNDLSATNRIDLIESIIGNWEADVADIIQLAAQFYRNYSNYGRC